MTESQMAEMARRQYEAIKRSAYSAVDSGEALHRNSIWQLSAADIEKKLAEAQSKASGMGGMHYRSKLLGD